MFQWWNVSPMPIKDALKPDLTHLGLWYHVSAHRSLSVLSVEVYSRIQQECVLRSTHSQKKSGRQSNREACREKWKKKAV